MKTKLLQKMLCNGPMLKFFIALIDKKQTKSLNILDSKGYTEKPNLNIIIILNRIYT